MSDAFGAARTLAERLGALAGFNEATYVDVRLVGFDGDGYLELNFRRRPAARARRRAELRRRASHPPEGAPRTLPVRRRFVYTVSRAAPASPRRSRRRPGRRRASGGAVPVAAVDDLVRADYIEQRLARDAVPAQPGGAAQAGARVGGARAAPQAAGRARDGGGPLPTWWVTTKYWYTDDGAGKRGRLRRHRGWGATGGGST